jgi:hypothetical protein
MCVEVCVITDTGEVYCETVGALAQAIGKAPEVVSPDGIEFCLCNVRWESLGARAANDDEGWPTTAFVIDARKHCTE